MNVLNETGDVKRYGAITLSHQEWIESGELDEYDQDLSVVPLSAILQEGNIAHIHTQQNHINERLKLYNPFRIKEINSFQSSVERKVVAESPEGVLFKQIQLNPSTVDLVIERNSRSFSRKVNGFSNDQIAYYLLPDILVAKHADVSDEVIAQII